MATTKIARYGFIDAIRGIAACTVMLQHSLYQSGLLGSFPNETLSGFIPNYLELGETGVVAFFLVSGFVIPLSLEKTNNFLLFWIHRALRIYPLYILIFLLTFSLNSGGNIRSIQSLLLCVAANLSFLQQYVKQPDFVGGSWTLSLEMVWYIGISGSFLLALNRKTMLITAGAVLISCMADIGCAHGLHLPMGRVSMLVLCVLGLLCYRLEQGYLSCRSFATLAAILVATIGINLFFGFQLFPTNAESIRLATVANSWSLAAIIFFVPFFLRHRTIWSHRLFSFLGRISYSVYLLHPVILLIFSMTPLRGFTLIVLTFAITIGAATITYHYVESPPIRFGHSARFKKMPTTQKIA